MKTRRKKLQFNRLNREFSSVTSARFTCNSNDVSSLEKPIDFFEAVLSISVEILVG